MLTFLAVCTIFVFGMLAAVINWENLINESVAFHKIKNPVTILRRSYSTNRVKS